MSRTETLHEYMRLKVEAKQTLEEYNWRINKMKELKKEHPWLGNVEGILRAEKRERDQPESSPSQPPPPKKARVAKKNSQKVPSRNERIGTVLKRMEIESNQGQPGNPQ